MRTSKIAALAATLGGAVWITSGALSWDDPGLSDLSTILWWVGLGLFAAASAFVGYSAVTDSPLWLRAVVFVGAAALGGSIASLLDIETDSAYLVVACAGGVLVLLGVIGLVVGRGKRHDDGDKPAPPVHGRRAAR